MIIKAKQLSKIYGSNNNKVIALNNVNLEINSGEFVSVIGPSGSGKSTLLHILSGLDNPTSGQVLLDDKDIYKGYLNEISSLLGIADRLNHLPHELSGGQQQRVAIARALIAKPDIIFADEPTGNLDSKSGSEVMNLLIKTSKQFGKTLVVITHDDRIAKLADRKISIIDGVLMEVK